MIEAVTGERYDGCPWRAFGEDGVPEVMEAAQSCRTDSGITPAMLLPSDPPQAVMTGLLHYARCVSMVRDDDAARAAEKARKASRGR